MANTRITATFVTQVNRALTPHCAVVKPNELQSAIDRPANMAYYEPQSSVTKRAATLAYGIMQNHPFLDANKRTAFWVANEYLKEQTGKGLTDAPVAAANTEMAMAAVEGAHIDVVSGRMDLNGLANVYERVLRSRR